MFAAGIAVAALGASAPALASQDSPKAGAESAESLGPARFRFPRGNWRVHHRRLKERLAGSHEWVEFEGTCSMRPLMDGYGNVDDNVLNMPEGAYRGVGLRSYDPKTGQWAIWWLDSRMPHNPLDPPVKGGFKDGVGTFYSDDTLRGKTIRVRYTWSDITQGLGALGTGVLARRAARPGKSTGRWISGGRRSRTAPAPSPHGAIGPHYLQSSCHTNGNVRRNVAMQNRRA